MDHNHPSGRPLGNSSPAGETASRRKFMRFGAAAAAAAAVGLADLAGVSSASASTKAKTAKWPFRGHSGQKISRTAAAQPGAVPDCSTAGGSCFCEPGYCGGRCPSGYWCNLCIDTACGTGYYCVRGGCSYSWHNVGGLCTIC